MADLNDLAPGTYIIVWYHGDRTGHERLLLREVKHVGRPKWAMGTPDDEIVVEVLEMRSRGQSSTRG